MLSSITSQLGNLMNKQKQPQGTESGEAVVEATAADQPATTTAQGSVLSNLTSQLGSFMGKKSAVDSPAAPVAEANEATSPPAAEQQQQQGSTASVLSSLSSVKNHIPNWLLGKQPAPDPPTITETTATPPVQDSSKASTPSSATGGADSEKELEIDTGLEKVKSLGNYLFSAVKGAGQKIKETNILENFQREHDSFLKSKPGKAEGVPPWVGHPKEEALKEEILGLSSDRRNFVRQPPPGVPFQFEWSEYEPIALALLREDRPLEQMRYDLVPKLVSEEQFWRNYFYRVMLLKESMEGDSAAPSAANRRPRNDSDLEQELNEELRSYEVVPSSKPDEKEIDALLDLK